MKSEKSARDRSRGRSTHGCKQGDQGDNVMSVIGNQESELDAQRDTEREAARVQANREELVERLARAVPKDGTVEPLKGLYPTRVSVPLQPVHGVLVPSFCVIAQGSKEVILGESRYRYDPGHYLLASVEMPNITRVLEASRERPYLSLRLELPPTLVGS